MEDNILIGHILLHIKKQQPNIERRNILYLVFFFNISIVWSFLGVEKPTKKKKNMQENTISAPNANGIDQAQFEADKRAVYK